MNADQLIQELNNHPEDIIEFLESITDENIQTLKDQSYDVELQKIKQMAEEILIVLQAAASGGYLVDVGRIQKIISMI